MTKPSQGSNQWWYNAIYRGARVSSVFLQIIYEGIVAYGVPQD